MTFAEFARPTLLAIVSVSLCVLASCSSAPPLQTGSSGSADSYDCNPPGGTDSTVMPDCPAPSSCTLAGVCDAAVSFLLDGGSGVTSVAVCMAAVGASEFTIDLSECYEDLDTVLESDPVSEMTHDQGHALCYKMFNCAE